MHTFRMITKTACTVTFLCTWQQRFYLAAGPTSAQSKGLQDHRGTWGRLDRLVHRVPMVHKALLATPALVVQQGRRVIKVQSAQRVSKAKRVLTAQPDLADLKARKGQWGRVVRKALRGLPVVQVHRAHKASKAK